VGIVGSDYCTVAGLMSMITCCTVLKEDHVCIVTILDNGCLRLRFHLLSGLSHRVDRN
jgi:hypothetical protein